MMVRLSSQVHANSRLTRETLYKQAALRSDLHSMQLRSKSMRQKLDAQVAAKTKILDETLARYRKAVQELDELRAAGGAGGSSGGGAGGGGGGGKGVSAASADVERRMREMESEIATLKREKRHLEKRSKFLEKRASRRGSSSPTSGAAAAANMRGSLSPKEREGL